MFDRPGTPLPPDEDGRLEALRSLRLLDGPIDPTYQELVELAADLLDVPIAAVNLIDRGRQWTLAGVGIGHGAEHARGDSFCAYAVADSGRPFVVEDAQADPRFAGNPFVEDGMRFYAGVPLELPGGHGVGTLCIADTAPRHLGSREMKVLASLARRAVAEFELRRATLRAERTAKELAAVLRFAPDAFIAMDRDGRVTAWNERAQEIFGYAPGEALSAHVSELIVPEELRHDHRAGLARHLATGESSVLGRTLELPAVRADGSRLHVELTLASVGDGEDMRFNAFARDISERKRAEAEAQATREFQRALLESLHEGIVACGADGRLTLFNRAGRDLHGVEASDVPPEEWSPRYALFSPDGRTALDTDAIPLHRAYRGEVVRDAEMVIAPKGLPARTVVANGQPIVDEDGRTLGAVVAMHDVTERRRAERLKDEFLALVSHELRTPLSSILGYTELLRESHDENERPDETRGRWLEVLERNGRRLQRLVGDLLFIAQLEGGRLGFERVPCDLAAVARECVEASIPRAGAAGVEVTFDADGPKPIHGDPDRLAQAVDNLISNAVKYTAGGGRVAVLVADGEHGPRVAVRDTGIGIPGDEQHRLFERFFRATTATERHIPGVGLGLTIVRAIAEGHGGTVSFASSEGEGTTFVVELPAAA